jgi:hypothetical protein
MKESDWHSIIIKIYMGAYIMIYKSVHASTYSFIAINMLNWSRVGNSYQRLLGDSEFSFFPASQDAVGDM